MCVQIKCAIENHLHPFANIYIYIHIHTYIHTCMCMYVYACFVMFSRRLPLFSCAQISCSFRGSHGGQPALRTTGFVPHGWVPPCSLKVSTHLMLIHT